MAAVRLGTGRLGAHVVEQLRDLLLDNGVGWLRSLAAGLALLALALCLHELALLSLSLGHGSLGVGAGPEAADAAGRTASRVLLDVAGVDGGEELSVGGGLKVHFQVRSGHGGLRRRRVEVKQVVLGGEGGEVVEVAKVLVARVVCLVDGHGVCEGTGDEAGLLAVHVVVVAGTAESLAGGRRHGGGRCGHVGDGAGKAGL